MQAAGLRTVLQQEKQTHGWQASEDTAADKGCLPADHAGGEQRLTIGNVERLYDKSLSNAGLT